MVHFCAKSTRRRPGAAKVVSARINRVLRAEGALESERRKGTMDTPMSLALRTVGGIGRLLGIGNDRPTAMAGPVALAERDLRLDFFRGLSLLFIFIDHIPDNFLSNVTLHSVAFSDAAEVFVFISGYAAALAYGHLFQSKGLLIATVHIYHRVWQLYVAHIFIFAVYAAMVSYSVLALPDPSFADSSRIAEFVSDPRVSLGEALLLRFQPQYMDILPLYIVLLAGFPLVLAALARRPLLALVPSGALYVLTQTLGWHTPAYPAGHTWFFNPLAWQLLFVIGAVVGYAKVRGVQWLPSSNWLAGSAMTTAGVVAVINLSWMVQSNFTDEPDLLFTALAPYVGDKSNLDPVRFASFLALALAAAHLVRTHSAVLSTRPAKWLIACGQNSLHIFCLGILLSVLGQFVLTHYDDGLAMQTIVDLIGASLMIGLGLLAAWYKAQTHAHYAHARAAVIASR
jgi:hypothetical protein